MVSDFTLLKKKLLLIASTGKFAQFPMKQVQKYHHELEIFLNMYGDSLDGIELLNLYEMQFYILLIVGKDIEAKVVLDRILNQFGSNSKSQRIKVLQSVYHEAIGERVVASSILEKNADDMKLTRRLTTFDRSNVETYINSLSFYLNINPSDLLAWAELAHVYSEAGEYEKSVFCYKEVLLHEPCAYPMFYRAGLNYYYNFLREEKLLKGERKEKLLELVHILRNSRDHYLRCIEICDVYTKSWVGLNLILNLKFNDKLNKYNMVKEIKTYLDENDKLRPLVEKRVDELVPNYN